MEKQTQDAKRPKPSQALTEYDRRRLCPNCKIAMHWVCSLAPGDEEARGRSDLYQCGACKTIKEV
jgi:hypothetical protein